MTEGQKTGGPRLAEDKRGISSRALVLGLLLVAAVCVIVSYAELVLMSIQIGFLQMPPAVIGIFFFMVLFNNALRALGSRLGLTPTELLMIYCMMVVAAMISSRGVMEKVLPLLVTPNYYHNQANRWHELFDAHIKKWMVAYDPSGAPQQKVAVRFFERVLLHTKGAWAGRPFALQPWQRDDVIRPLVGWKRRIDGRRRYRYAYLSWPRKNGKSTTAAIVGLYMLDADGEEGLSGVVAAEGGVAEAEAVEECFGALRHGSALAEEAALDDGDDIEAGLVLDVFGAGPVIFGRRRREGV